MIYQNDQCLISNAMEWFLKPLDEIYIDFSSNLLVSLLNICRYDTKKILTVFDIPINFMRFFSVVSEFVRTFFFSVQSL